MERLAWLETRRRPIANAQGSGAMGYFQTMGPFHREAMAASGGLNSRSTNYAEAAAAVGAWIRRHRPLRARRSRKVDSTTPTQSCKNGSWPSLPGGSQAQAAAVQRDARSFLPPRVRHQKPISSEFLAPAPM